MRLKSAIQSYQRIPEINRSRIHLGEQPKLVVVAADLAARFEGIASLPKSEDLKNLVYRLQQQESLTKKDWKKAAWCLWLPEMALCQDQRFMQRYRDWIMAHASKSVIRTLIHAYLYGFRENDAAFQEVSVWLRQAVLLWPWIWGERQQQLNLFDCDGAVEKIAALAIKSDSGIYKFLQQSGLCGALGLGGLAAACVYRILGMLEKSLSGSQPDRRLLQSCIDFAREANAAHSPALRANVAESLLLPWVEHIPPKDIQETILEFLLCDYKDPRIHRSNWRDISGAAEAVIRRWLTRESLEQFIQVVDQTAKVEQWQYRRAFWMAYFKGGYIQDATVLFAPSGASYARNAFKNSYFGHLEQGYYSADQAVLLMKIGDLTIADWSHNGSCRIYLPDNKNTPSLNQQNFHARKLRLDCDNDLGAGTRHMGSEKGTWQAKVADFIRQHTGITVPRYQYMDILS